MSYFLMATVITIAWIGLFVFYAILSDRQKRLEGEIEQLQAQIDRLRQDHPTGE